MVLRNLLEAHNLSWPARDALETLQVNMGRLCNMTCSHCHVNAGPAAKEVMDEETTNGVIRFLFRERISRLDITGGAPEMAPTFRHLVSTTKDLVDEIIVRCNLTVLFEPGMEDLPHFSAENSVHLVCSLPCYTEENVDRQRGAGTFEKSVAALKLLNRQGYGKEEELPLDLVYNPGGAFLPGSQAALERDYKTRLREDHGIEFDRLITIVNMPISRFGNQLEKDAAGNGYASLLAERFNPSAVEGVMCRNLLSVGWDGTLYDCDFNQALGLPVRGGDGKPLTLEELKAPDLIGMEVRCADHCLGCVAGEGSSCSGALV